MGALMLVVLCTAVVTSGCADSSAEQDGGKEAVKAVKTDAVRQESVRRTLEVVGTLAAEDQVTVSSEVDGVVPVESDNESGVEQRPSTIPRLDVRLL